MAYFVFLCVHRQEVDVLERRYTKQPFVLILYKGLKAGQRFSKAHENSKTNGKPCGSLQRTALRLQQFPLVK